MPALNRPLTLLMDLAGTRASRDLKALATRALSIPRPLAFALVLTLLPTGAALAGELEPTGPPAPTMKTLSETDPGIPIRPEDAPVVLDAAGSYFLTGDLDCSGMSGFCVQILADDIALDLREFTIRGGTNTTVFGTLVHEITIKNGQVVDGGNYGIAFNIDSEGFRLENLTVSGHDQYGIYAGNRSIVISCRAENNGNAGIRVGSHSLVLDSIADGNSGAGISVGSHSRVRGAIAANNSDHGIRGGGSAVSVTVEHSTASGNTRFGIRAGAASRVLFNQCYDNTDDGQKGAGIAVSGSDSRVEGNHVVGNDYGIWVTGTGNLVVRNSASGNLDDYQVVGGNDVGPIGSATSAVSPWANIQF